MQSFMLGGRKGAGAHIVYGAKADKLFVGISRIPEDDHRFCSIDIYYSADVFSTILKIAKTMESRAQTPEVFIKRKWIGVKSYVAVVFQLKAIDVNLAKEILGHALPDQAVSKLRGEKVEILATGEADFRVSDLNPFLMLFRQTGSFVVGLCQTGQGCQWTTTLRTFKTTIQFQL